MYSDVRRITCSELGYFKVETHTKKTWYIRQDKLAGLWPDVVDIVLADGSWEFEEEDHKVIDIESLLAKLVITEISNQETTIVYGVKPTEPGMGTQYFLEAELDALSLLATTGFQKTKVLNNKRFSVEVNSEPICLKKKNAPKGCRAGI